MAFAPLAALPVRCFYPLGPKSSAGQKKQSQTKCDATRVIASHTRFSSSVMRCYESSVLHTCGRINLLGYFPSFLPSCPPLSLSPTFSLIQRSRKHHFVFGGADKAKCDGSRKRRGRDHTREAGALTAILSSTKLHRLTPDYSTSSCLFDKKSQPRSEKRALLTRRVRNNLFVQTSRNNPAFSPYYYYCFVCIRLPFFSSAAVLFDRVTQRVPFFSPSPFSCLSLLHSPPLQVEVPAVIVVVVSCFSFWASLLSSSFFDLSIFVN
jgi:hypothetical protein